MSLQRKSHPVKKRSGIDHTAQGALLIVRFMN